jgi:diguanylate cyclase (GGDEF)-like protein
MSRPSESGRADAGHSEPGSAEPGSPEPTPSEPTPSEPAATHWSEPDDAPEMSAVPAVPATPVHASTSQHASTPEHHFISHRVSARNRFHDRESAVARRTAEEQARFATRFAGQLLFGGAALSAVLSSVLGLNRGGPFSAAWYVTYAACLIAGLSGVRLMRMRRAAPPWVLTAVPSAAAVLITVAMVTDRSGALDGMVLLTWPVLFAGYLLRRRAAWWTLGFVLVCLSVIVLAGEGPNEVSNLVELATSVTLTLIVILRLRGQADRLKEALAEQARTDDLTGLDNRRAFTEALDREYMRFRRYRRPLSLLAVDVDHFKLVNDTWGHAAGDTALRALGALLAMQVRASDVVGRIGGEEFGVLMPDCGPQQASKRADALRAAVHDQSLAWEHPITVSIGVATIPDDAGRPEELQDAADGALYAAKAAGRNRVHGAGTGTEAGTGAGAGAGTGSAADHSPRP